MYSNMESYSLEAFNFFDFAMPTATGATDRNKWPNEMIAVAGSFYNHEFAI
jgi:hypothetical protein